MVAAHYGASPHSVRGFRLLWLAVHQLWQGRDRKVETLVEGYTWGSFPFAGLILVAIAALFFGSMYKLHALFKAKGAPRRGTTEEIGEGRLPNWKKSSKSSSQCGIAGSADHHHHHHHHLDLGRRCRSSCILSRSLPLLTQPWPQPLEPP
jgi:hypothetical protein